ncbi:hypothetical protein [Streptomyces sp. NPDC002463]|uniref:hypothetical protein n=1 Tax=Streptomyces sp. NPDC002463 TaxID=3364645 RepID=UPI0036CA697A
MYVLVPDLEMLSRVRLPEAARSVALPAEEEREYRRFCEGIVTILGSGDTFTYRSHRAMYF